MKYQRAGYENTANKPQPNFFFIRTEKMTANNNQKDFWSNELVESVNTCYT